nr:ABC transporter substrate-binding protein [uncultured Schaedlerella sp.]
MKRKKVLSILLAFAMCAGVLAGCGEKETDSTWETDSGGTEESDKADKSDSTAGGDTVELSMWFWGSTSEQQAALSKNLIDQFNETHPGYHMTVEYRSSVNKDVAVALSADEGPDIIYESSPSLALNYIRAGKYANLDAYAEKYGWSDKLLGCMYDSGVYEDSLYFLPMGLNVIGMVYNKEVLEENHWEVPETVEELTAIMDAAMEQGMYASVTGNKGWQPTNEDYTSLFLNSFGGPDKVYGALTDQIAWTDEALTGAIRTSSDWYEKGYLCSDYLSLDWADSAVLLADGRAPFYFGPMKFIQNLIEHKDKDLFGFTAFPAASKEIPAVYTVGATGLLAINEKTEHKEVCAEFLDMMMTNDFVEAMANDWPGYWAVPLTTLNEIDMSSFEGLPLMFMEGIAEACEAIDAGNFGYYNSSYMPAEAFDKMCVVDSVWLGEKDADAFMEDIDASFQKEFDAGTCPICPAPDGE